MENITAERILTDWNSVKTGITMEDETFLQCLKVLREYLVVRQMQINESEAQQYVLFMADCNMIHFPVAWHLMWASCLQTRRIIHRCSFPALLPLINKTPTLEEDTESSWILYDNFGLFGHLQEETKEIEEEDGTMIWRRNGVNHRLGGPAVVKPNGETEYWLYGRRVPWLLHTQFVRKHFSIF